MELKRSVAKRHTVLQMISPSHRTSESNSQQFITDKLMNKNESL